MTATLRAWLAPVWDQLPTNPSAERLAQLQQAINDEALRHFGAFLAGVQAYQTAQAEREESPEVQVIWQQGSTRLIDYAPGTDAPAILVVPSLVNRFEILDIDPDHSFLRFLARQGFRPLVVDWQEPGDEEKNFTLSDYMTKRLVPILDSLGGACHILGYCMGGVLALALSLMRPALTRSLTLMATPWDFSHGVGGVPPVQTPMGEMFLRQGQGLSEQLQKLGYLPAEMLQGVFTAFQPLQIVQKFARFADLSSDEAGMRRFVLTEDWLNDGVPLAFPVAMECLRDWYAANQTARGVWSVADVRVDPAQVAAPTCVLVAGKDRIVPPDSSRPLARLIRGAQLLETPLGHIGLMTGDAAPQEAWLPLVNWLRLCGRSES